MYNFNGKPHLIIQLLMMLILISAVGIISNSRAGELVQKTSYPSDAGLYDNVIKFFPDEPGLGFPFDPPRVIEELRSFGIPQWGEPEEEHFGIDLIPDYKSPSFPWRKSTRKVRVVAPSAGTIWAIFALDSTEAPGNKDISVILEINSFWSVILMFEPKSSPGLPVREQVRSITVKAGQQVKKGDEIGQLVVGEGIGGYPHLHFALLYKHSSTSYMDIFRDIVSVPNVDANDLGLPVTGPGSPWEPCKLDLPNNSLAAFFCPYEFSTPRAKQIFDYVLNNTEYPCGPGLGKCNCVCIYNSTCNK